MSEQHLKSITSAERQQSCADLRSTRHGPKVPMIIRRSTILAWFS
jgi:hypothetical protein